MTLPYERSRSIVQTREFLLELSRDETLPEPIRREARRLLRHYPMPKDVFRAGQQELIDPKLILEPVFATSIDGSF